MNRDFDAQARVRVDQHFAGCFAHIDSDFRATSLNALIASYVRGPSNVMDMGCGVGTLSAVLYERGNQVVSQDVSPAMVRMCKKHLGDRGLPTHRVRVGPVEALEQETYDYVIALDVIEHIEDDVAAMVALHAALKPGGQVILSVPALEALYGPKDVRLGHYRRYDRRQLTNLLRRVGFRDVSWRYWNFVGLVPVWLSLRLRSATVPEGYRYSRGPAARFLNSALRAFFIVAENRMRPPLGLTLIAVATRRE